MTDVLVVGSLNVDLVVRTPRFPAPGETILGDDISRSGGGKGMNQAVAAARLGMGTVSLVGCLGSDPDGDWLTGLAAAAGVDCRLKQVADPTGTALITVDASGENTIVVVAGANGAVTAAQVSEAILAHRPRVVSVMLEVPMAAVAAAAAAGRQAGARVILNPSPYQALDDQLLAATDVLVLNELEIEQLTGLAWQHASQQVAKWLRERDLVGVVTLGARGAAVVCDGVITEVGAPAVAAVDTVGCGDAFTGALAVRLAAGDSLAEAASYACRVAAYAATGHGAQPSYGTASQIAQL